MFGVLVAASWLALAGGEAFAQSLPSFTTFTVNSTGGGNDGVCDAEHCTLAEAIDAANKLPGLDIVKFNLSLDGDQIIRPTAPLPAITDPLIVDGTSQPSYEEPRVRVDGASLDDPEPSSDGFVIAAGPTAIRGLVITNFSRHGISVIGGDGNVIVENSIGSYDPYGREGANGNGVNGIRLNGGTGTRIGGAEEPDGNNISGNGAWGVRVGDTASNEIVGNLVGEGFGSDFDPNGAGGVRIDDGFGTLVHLNEIVGNLGPGVDVVFSSRNTITRNEIGENSAALRDGVFLGIDLGADGVTPNGDRDGEAGPNDFQNFPVLETVTSDGADVVDISGDIVTAAYDELRLDFYANEVCDPSGFGEGERWIGSIEVFADPSGEASFDTMFSPGVPVGDYVTATATDDAGNTSEFSQCAEVTEPVELVEMQNAEECVPTADGGFTLDFDDAPLGPVGDRYAFRGVHFLDDDFTTPLIYDNEEDRRTVSPPNSLTNDGDTDQGSVDIPLTIRFDLPQASVGFYMGNGQSEFGPEASLSAYDAEGKFLGSLSKTVSSNNVLVFFGATDPLGRIREVRLDYGETRLSEEIDDLCFTAPRVPGATNVMLTVDRRAIPAGSHTVPLEDVPADRIPLFAGADTGDVSVPVGADEVDSTPIGRIPIGRIPIGRIPIGRIPIGRIGLDTGPNGTVPLEQILLSSLPVQWDTIFESPSPNAGRPIQTLTLADVYDDPTVYADGSTPQSRFEALEVGKTGLDRTLLRGIGIGALALGDVELDAIEPPPGFVTWCDALAAAGGSCAGVNTATNTLVGLSIAGAPIGRIPIGRIPIGRIPIGRIPIGRIPIGRIDIPATPLAEILIADLANRDVIVDCTVVGLDCLTDTLGDAYALDAIRPDATLADLEGAFADSTTFAEILLGLLPRSAFPWESFPIDGVQEYAGTGDVLRYAVDFDLDCSNADDLSVSVKLPDGYIVDLGTTQLEIGDAGPVPGPDPTTDSDTGATWTGLPDFCEDGTLETQHVRLSFDALSGFRLATLGGTAIVATGPAQAVAADEAPTLVTQNFEQNDEPEEAPLIEPDELKIGHVARSGDLEIFQLEIPERGARTTVLLSHIAEGADFDLAVAKPEAVPLQSAPIGRIPIGRIPIEDRGSSLNDADQALPPETLEDVPIGRIPIGRIGVGSVSANRGNADEVVELLSGGEDGFYTIIVSGYNGSHSDLPFVLRVVETPPPVLPPCPARVFGANNAPGTLPASLPADTKTLFLVNRKRMSDMYGVAETDAMLAQAALVAARPEVKGHILEVDGNEAVRDAYAAWDDDPCSIEAANDVVRKINDVVAGYRPLPDLANVVLLGTDEAVPMARVPDLVTLAPEFDEAIDLEFTTNGLTAGNALYASAATGHVLTDNAYVAFTAYEWLGRELFLPQVSAGRLVETPAEIGQQLGAYVDFDGVLDPDTALTTAYDFLTDGGEAVADALGNSVPTVDDTLISDTWTKNDLLNVLTSKPSPDDVLSVNAHYNHYALEPAAPVNPAGFQASDLVTSDEVVAAVEDEFVGRMLFTMGCHGGLNVGDTLGAPTGEDALLRDWVQSYGRQQTAVYIANTGFGYGDTEANALSERLMTLFAEKLGESPTIGADWVQAVHEYYTSAGVYGVYDEKVMIESTFYGLPFWRVEGAGTGPEHTPPETEDDPTTGLERARITIGVPAVDRTRFDIARGTFWDFLGQTLDIHYRPIQPRITRNVTIPDKVAHGAIITALETQDEPVADPVLGQPTIDLAANEPEKTFQPIFFPANVISLTRSAIGGDELQNVVLVGGQFRPADLPADSRERLVNSASVDVAYSTSADFVPPQIHQVGAVRVGGTAELFVETTDDSPATVKRVATLVNDGTGWTFYELTQVGTSNMWRRTITVGPGQLEILAQSQDSAGNVGFSTKKGENFDAIEDDAGPEILIDSPLPDALYGRGQVVLADFACSDPGGVSSCVGTVSDGSPIATTPAGQFTFTVTATDLAGHQTTETRTYNVGGRMTVLKTTQGGSAPVGGWTFTLFAGPDGFDGGALLATDNTPPRLLDFGNLNLDPGKAYTVCEQDVPAAWTSRWKVDKNGDGIADTIVHPYNPNADDGEAADLGNRCVDFGAGTPLPLRDGGILVFQVDNSFPGGEPRSPGYWKNWSSCSGGGQYQNAVARGGGAAGFWTLDELLTSPGPRIGDMVLNGVWNDDPFKFRNPPLDNDCVEAVRILDKRDAKDAKKRASDGAYELASPLLAARLNLVVGSKSCQAVRDAVTAGQKLLDGINFTGTGSYLPSSVKGTLATKRAKALDLASRLSKYNNGKLCP